MMRTRVDFIAGLVCGVLLVSLVGLIEKQAQAQHAHAVASAQGVGAK